MKTIVLFILCFSLILTAHGQRPKITVNFKILEPGYQNNYGDGINKIAAQSKVRIIQSLKTRFGFLEFVSSNTNTTLTIELDDKERSFSSASHLNEVGFFISITGEGIESGLTPQYWMFKPAIEYFDPLPALEATFVERIALAFEKQLGINLDQLTVKLLCKIPIVKDAHFVEEQEFWIIPVNRDSFLIANKSKLVIENHQQFDLMDPVERYDTTMVISALTDINRASQVYKVPVNYPIGSLVTRPVKHFPFSKEEFPEAPRVFIIQYRPYSKPLPPSDPNR